MIKPILHLVTQDNQPYGSRRKCCERCGLAVNAMDGVSEGWTDDHSQYKKKFAKKNEIVRCCD